MDYLSRLLRQTQLAIGGAILFCNAVLIGSYWIASNILHLSSWLTLLVMGGAAVILTVVVAVLLGGYLLQPARALWQLILHVSPSEHGVAAPDVESLKIGRELVASLMAQVYQLANVVDQTNSANSAPNATGADYGFTATNLPLPLFVLDAEETIQFANVNAANYVGQPAQELVGKNVYMVLDMAFPSESTLDTWLKHVKANNATATASWERVRLNVLELACSWASVTLLFFVLQCIR